MILTAVYKTPNDESWNSAKRYHHIAIASTCRFGIFAMLIRTWLLFYKDYHETQKALLSQYDSFYFFLPRMLDVCFEEDKKWNDRTVDAEASVGRNSDMKRLQVKTFVEETLRKGVNGLIAEFKGMRRINDFTLMTEFVVQNPLGRNRYKDVGCLDNCRVVLHIGSVSYIHANYVSTPCSPRRFICTQAPLPKTCPDFWHMVVQEKSAAIIMLCNFTEQNANKCATYFPTTIGVPLSFEGDVHVVMRNQEMFAFPFETKVRVRVTHLDVSVPGQPVHNCTHYHWLDWPDRGVPEADLAPIALLTKVKDSTAPIIVHCSAGIGRTGSIVLIQHALELLQKNLPLMEISTYLVELRKQRNNSIQTEHQYLYIHQVLLLYLKQYKYLDDSVNQYLEAFTRDYYKATKGF